MEQTMKKRKRRKLAQPVASAKPCGYLYFIPIPKTTTNETPATFKSNNN